MYSIISKTKENIISYIADSDDDVLRLTDACAPGSTIEVLENPTHTFIKRPSGNWVLYKGESELEIPANDAKIEILSEDSLAPGTEQKISTFQKGITLYQNGVVTGTLKNAVLKGNTDYPEDQKTGHYLTVGLKTPEEASSYDIITKGVVRKTMSPCDGWFRVRMENMYGDPYITIKYDTGESFTFILDQLDLE